RRAQVGNALHAGDLVVRERTGDQLQARVSRDADRLVTGVRLAAPVPVPESLTDLLEEVGADLGPEHDVVRLDDVAPGVAVGDRLLAGAEQRVLLAEDEVAGVAGSGHALEVRGDNLLGNLRRRRLLLTAATLALAALALLAGRLEATRAL